MRFILMIVTTILFISEVKKVVSDDVMQKNLYDGETEPLQEQRRKKPFCNEFTGCGRKRADDSMVNLYDISDEPNSETFKRQIPMTAKLWAILQNASKYPRDRARPIEQSYFAYRRRRCGLGNNLC